MRLQGLVYRAHHPGWAWAPESGRGAELFGGRFNCKGVAALYTSMSLQGAWSEAQQAFPFKAQPMTLCAYEVDCEDILDLRGVPELQSDLACAWEAMALRGETPPSWTLADRLIAAGKAGILVPSFAKGAETQPGNAVFWRWGPEPPHRVRVVDDHGRLPRDALSWRDESG
ncbi:MAG: RES domain-containing protein [Geminicoccaceae bacterium]